MYIHHYINKVQYMWIPPFCIWISQNSPFYSHTLWVLGRNSATDIHISETSLFLMHHLNLLGLAWSWLQHRFWRQRLFYKIERYICRRNAFKIRRGWWGGGWGKVIVDSRSLVWEKPAACTVNEDSWSNSVIK